MFGLHGANQGSARSSMHQPPVQVVPAGHTLASLEQSMRAQRPESLQPNSATGHRPLTQAIAAQRPPLVHWRPGAQSLSSAQSAMQAPKLEQLAPEGQSLSEPQPMQAPPGSSSEQLEPIWPEGQSESAVHWPMGRPA